MKHFVQVLIVFLLVAISVMAQNDMIVPPEDLVVEGVPQIPASYAKTVVLQKIF